MLWTAGYTRNPLGTTSATQLTLTLPDGTVTLPVVARAQGGGIGTVALHHQRASGLELYAQLQTSTLPQASTSGRVALGGPLALIGFSLCDSVLATAFAAADRKVAVEILQDAVAINAKDERLQRMAMSGPIMSLSPLCRMIASEELFQEGVSALAAANAP